MNGRETKMKGIQTVLVVLFFTAVLSVPAFAAGRTDYYADQLEASGANELYHKLPGETRELLKELGIDKVDFYSIYDTSPRKFIDLLIDTVKQKSDGPLKSAFRLTGIIILISIAESFVPKDDKSKKVLFFVSGLLIAVSIAVPLSQAVSRAASSIYVSGSFMLLLIPVLAGVVAVSGNPMLAVSYNSIAFAFAQAVSQTAKNIVVPFTGIYMVTGIAGSLMPEFKIGVLTETIKKTAVTVLSFSAALFVAFLSIKGIMANTADTMASKGIKLVVKTVVPVLGGALSDAYSSIAGSLSLVRSAVGVFGIIAVALIAVPSLIELMLWAIPLKIVAACSDMFGLEDQAEMLRTLSSAASLLGVAVLFNAVLLIVATGVTLAVRAVA